MSQGEDMGGSYLSEPNYELIAWSAAVVVVLLLAGGITAAKGHRRLLLLGVLLLGLPWIYGAALPARPGSWWARRRGPGG